MEYKNSPYFHVAHARDLTGRDRVIYRLLEILPGFLSWGTFLAIILCSIFVPVQTAIFIIAFDLYWLLKTIHLSYHHYYNWRRLKHNSKKDWYEMLQNMKFEHLQHLVILPYYKEGIEVKGKGPNIAYASEEARKLILDRQGIKYEDVMVSAFDIDTVIWPQYFACLTWHFLTAEDPYNKSYQPVPLYNNNIWHAPALSRVAAITSTFWQMIQQERPEKLATFSSHSIPFKSLYEVGYWQKNMISDDSRIFWNLFAAKDGNYAVVPIAYPVSMDANLAPTLFGTLRNIYKQHFRWMWGVENIPYMLFSFIKNKKIHWKQKLSKSFTQIVGFWSLATNPIMILVLGWLPIFLGGNEFRTTILSYNLPIVTRTLLMIAMAGVIFAAIVSASLLPPMPPEFKRRKFRWITMTLQWLFVPFTIIIFGSFPGLHAQTRLMLGKYVGAFWVTPKHRK